MEIKDSGTRRIFGDNAETSAVRDMSEGKGRFDLLPLETIAEITQDPFYGFMAEKDYIGAVRYLMDDWWSEYGAYECLLKLAKHFEDGAKKYKENNWRTGTGIPAESYIDSALRHYTKVQCEWDDEPHAVACVWNLVCLIWSIDNLYESDPIETDCDSCLYWCDDKKSEWYLKCVVEGSCRYVEYERGKK